MAEEIQEAVQNGKQGKLPPRYMEIVETYLKGYAERVYHILLEHGYNLWSYVKI